jgi:hypothetical protein
MLTIIEKSPFSDSFTITIHLLIVLQCFSKLISLKYCLAKTKVCESMSKRMVIVKLWVNSDKHRKIECLWSNEEMIDDINLDIGCKLNKKLLNKSCWFSHTSK